VLSAARAYLRIGGADLGSSLALYGAYVRAVLPYAPGRNDTALEWLQIAA